jgi:hypothetical protein
LSSFSREAEMAEQNPLAKYQLQKIGGPSRRNTEGMFTNASGNAARDARRAARRDMRPMTFAEMQADGIARPPAPGLEMFTGPAETPGLEMFTPQQSSLIVGEDDYSGPPASTPPATATPTAAATPPIGDAPAGGQIGSFDSYTALRNAALANLQAQFGAQRQSLDEELARRGLSASTFGAGRMGDLAGQQARATASLEAELLAQEQARRASNNDMLLRIATLLGLGG